MENNEEIKNYVPNQIVSKEDLKTYFENGDVPDEQDFWEWQDSYWHKNDPQDIIPADRVDLSGKADKNATNLDGENVQNWRTKLNIQDPTQIIPVSNTESGIVNNTSLQELGGVDKLINKVRIGKGSGNTAAIIEDSTALGDSALSSNTTGKNNTAIGANVLKVNTTGGFNTGIGDYALWSNTTGIWNTAIGSAALVYNTTGQRNVALASALYHNKTGSHNSGLGHSAAYANESGNYNSYVGRSAGYDNGVGSYNVGIGYAALSISAAGYLAGGSTINMNNNVFIGSNVRGLDGMNDTLAIDNKGATVTQAANALIYGGFSAANRFLNVGGKLSVTPSYMPNAQGDAMFTKNIVAKADGSFGWEDKAESTKQIVKTISSDITLDDTYHNCIVRIIANSAITIPSGLRSDFNCVFDAIGTIIGTFVAGSGVTLSAPFGLKLKSNSMCTLYKTDNSSFRLNGNLSINNL